MNKTMRALVPKVVFQQNLIFHPSMPGLDLALSHRAIRAASRVTHFVLVQPVSDSQAPLDLMCTGDQVRRSYRQSAIALIKCQPMFWSDCYTL